MGVAVQTCGDMKAITDYVGDVRGRQLYRNGATSDSQARADRETASRGHEA
jgi:hypothetical protein